MDLTQAIILSIVEGVTEFLPISSTGHLVLATELMNIEQTEFVKSFEIIIQLGAILAIVFLYWKTLVKDKKVWLNILAAFLPTAIIGLIFYEIIKKVLIGNPLITILALFFGGIFLIVIEYLHTEKESAIPEVSKLSLKQSFMIGIAQSFSIIPGVSRAAATIIGALLLGTKRKVAVEFSFLLAIPTMFAATSLDLIKTNFSFSLNEYLLLLVGFIGSFITALIVVRWFVKFVQTNNFILFGIYRIVIAILFYLFII